MPAGAQRCESGADARVRPTGKARRNTTARMNWGPAARRTGQPRDRFDARGLSTASSCARPRRIRGLLVSPPRGEATPLALTVFRLLKARPVLTARRVHLLFPRGAPTGSKARREAPAALALDRKKVGAFSVLGGRFLPFPIGDRRCKRTRASVGNAGGNARPSPTNATLAASRLLHRRSPTAPCSKGLAGASRLIVAASTA